jgi:hypothetical protein
MRQASNPRSVRILVLAVAAASLLLCWLVPQQTEEAPPTLVEERREDHAASAGAVQPATPAVREIVDPFPDGRVWLRVRGGDEPPKKLSFQWDRGEERCVLFPPAIRPDVDGWWKVPFPAPRDPLLENLAVCAAGYAVSWLIAASSEIRYEIELVPLDQVIEVRDAETGQLVRGARIRASRAPVEGEAWQLDSFPGAGSDVAIYHATEGPGLYELNGRAAAAPHHYELEHEHYVLATGSPSTLELGSRVTRLLVQMPVVASVRYVGDHVLDGRLGFSGKPSTDSRIHRRLRDWHKQLTEKHKDTLTRLFMKDLDEIRIRDPKYAVAECWLRHGERRVDNVPVVRLSEFSGPLEIRVVPAGPQITLQEVTLEGPPKFGEVEANFKLILQGKDRFLRIVKPGEKVLLPPGHYSVTGQGDWGFGALARERFSVRSGESATFRLQWREGIHMYLLHLSGPAPVRVAQVEWGQAPRLAVVTAPVGGDGRAVFWVRSEVTVARVHVQGYESTEVVFARTSDPRIFRGECGLVALPSK